MTARDDACLKELSRLIEDGLTPEAALEAAIKRNTQIADVCSRMGKHDLAAVANNRLEWYLQRRRTD